ncbi:MAG: hypothetical protein AAB426_04825 [Myxococcota bacterium]
MGVVRFFACFLGGMLLFAHDAHAYLDPGTGSLVIQALAATLLGVAVTARLWTAAIKRAVRRLLGRPALTEGSTDRQRSNDHSP